MMKILAEYRLRAVIFHGFIGSAQQAKRAIDAGHYLSFGPNALRSPKTIAALQSIPESRLFAETDDSGEMIENVYSKIAQTRGISVEELRVTIENNYNKIFNI
jgi:TatD DNase family protein